MLTARDVKSNRVAIALCRRHLHIWTRPMICTTEITSGPARIGHGAIQDALLIEVRIPASEERCMGPRADLPLEPKAHHWAYLVLLVFSITLSLSTAALWVRSQGANDGFRFTHAGVVHELWSSQGYFGYGSYRDPDLVIRFDGSDGRYVPLSPLYYRVLRPAALPVDPAARTLAGFGVNWSFARFGSEIRDLFGVCAPYWVLIAIGCLLPARQVLMQFRHSRCESRAGHGLCRRCAYNLVTNLSGVCPECGSPCDQRASAGRATPELLIRASHH